MLEKLEPNVFKRIYFGYHTQKEFLLISVKVVSIGKKILQKIFDWALFYLVTIVRRDLDGWKTTGNFVEI